MSKKKALMKKIDKLYIKENELFYSKKSGCKKHDRIVKKIIKLEKLEVLK